MEIFTVSTVFIHIVHLINLKGMKEYNNHDYCLVDMPEEGKAHLKTVLELNR